MKYQISNRILKKPLPLIPDLAGSVGSVVTLVSDLNLIKENVIKTIDDKLKEVDTKVQGLIEKADQIESGKKEIENTSQEVIDAVKQTIEIIQNTKEDAIQAIKDIKQGEVGPPADEEKIIQSILKKLPKPVDEKALTKKILSKIPDAKANLKIIQEKFEVDPMSIIDKIMALPEEKRAKLKLSRGNVDGLEQTIQAFQSQLGRGYLHGGGLAKVSTDGTLTGDGTPTNPLHALGGGSGGQVNTIVAGTGISVNSTNPVNPIVTNTLPDQVVSILAGTNITSVTGTYPTFTVNAASQGGGDFFKNGSVQMTGTFQTVAGTLTIAPIKIVAGVNLTTPIAGVIEFDGSKYYVTI